MNRSFVAFVIALAFINLGTIRRDEDPVLKTQTDPIALKQKMDEIKDGVKGAPAPSFKYYEKEDFFARTPMKSALEEPAPNSKPQNELDAITEVQTQHSNVSENVNSVEKEAESEVKEKSPLEKEEKEEDDWWVEDQT